MMNMNRTLNTVSIFDSYKRTLFGKSQISKNNHCLSYWNYKKSFSYGYYDSYFDKLTNIRAINRTIRPIYNKFDFRKRTHVHNCDIHGQMTLLRRSSYTRSLEDFKTSCEKIYKLSLENYSIHDNEDYYEEDME